MTTREQDLPNKPSPHVPPARPDGRTKTDTCCPSTQQTTCCEPAQKAGCCHEDHSRGCGCR
jgi:hypothetical protein